MPYDDIDVFSRKESQPSRNISSNISGSAGGVTSSHSNQLMIVMIIPAGYVGWGVFCVPRSQVSGFQSSTLSLNAPAATPPSSSETMLLCPSSRGRLSHEKKKSRGGTHSSGEGCGCNRACRTREQACNAARVVFLLISEYRGKA